MTLRPDRFVTASLGIVLLALSMVSLGSGCANGRYYASKLPVEFIATAPLNLEAINLSGLADRSISSEVIQPGDVLDVTMVTDYSKLTTTTTPTRVGDDGGIMVPLIGKVGVSGLSAEQAEQVIAAESISRGVFRTPCITVTMKQCRTNKVTVVGAVNQPGTHDLPRGSSSLLAALVAAGGLSKEASTDVEIRQTDSRALVPGGPVVHPPRVANAPGPEGALTAYETTTPGPSVVMVSLAAAASGMQKAPALRDGDVVYVAKRTLPPIHVLGLVTKPGEFPFPPSQELRVLDALAVAGGCSSPVAEKVLVIRHLPNRKEPIQIAVSIQAAKSGQDNITLAPDDTVMVEQTPETVMVDIMKSFIHFTFGTNPIF
jgi:polysaccharide export outer membrane protein